MLSPTTTKIQDFNVQRFPKEYMNLPTEDPGTHDPHRPPQTSSGAEGEPATKRKPEARKRWMGRIHPNAMDVTSIWDDCRYRKPTEKKKHKHLLKCRKVTAISCMVR